MLTDPSHPPRVEIEASARKHGVWRAFETDDPDVTMLIGPSPSAAPLDVGVVTDDDGVAIIHAMPARA